MSGRPGKEAVPRSDALVFFGATGDLAHKQIFPALHGLVRRGLLRMPIIGVSHSATPERLREIARDSVAAPGGSADAALEALAGDLQAVGGDYADPATYRRIKEALGEARHPLFYLAIPPSLFETVVNGLAAADCVDGARVIVEKPFGRDLASARELDRTIHAVFPESAMFRIDHFLGKEPVQNIVYFRLANPVLETVWHRDHIESVQITMAESFGVAGRGAFYEEAGAIRDVVQNHLLQVLALLAMEPPNGLEGDPLRDEKSKVLRAIAPLEPDEVVRGQYEGYRAEDGVAADSTVETYAAVRLHVDTWRWAGVPFLIRAGKCLPTTATELLVRLRRPPQRLLADLGDPAANRIRFRISPDVSIALEMNAKRPGERMLGEPLELMATRRDPDVMAPYERLLADAMDGDQSLFARQDGVEAAWRIVDPILGGSTPVHSYASGSWGPAEAARLVAGIAAWEDPTG